VEGNFKKKKSQGEDDINGDNHQASLRNNSREKTVRRGTGKSPDRGPKKENTAEKGGSIRRRGATGSETRVTLNKKRETGKRGEEDQRVTEN